jgi:hypothetical protein
MQTRAMSSFERSLDRRPVLPIRFEARARRSEKLWRRVLLYYLRHAERVWRREDLGQEVRHQLKLARADITTALATLGAALGYENGPVIETLHLEARFPEVVEYAELFEMADRVFWSLQYDAVEGLTRAEMHRIRIQVSQALRSPAQVVADTPGLDQVTAPR